jgi:hypothetical protein
MVAKIVVDADCRRGFLGHVCTGHPHRDASRRPPMPESTRTAGGVARTACHGVESIVRGSLIPPSFTTLPRPARHHGRWNIVAFNATTRAKAQRWSSP